MGTDFLITEYVDPIVELCVENDIKLMFDEHHIREHQRQNIFR